MISKVWTAMDNGTGLLDVAGYPARGSMVPGDFLDVINGSAAGRYRVREITWYDDQRLPHLSLTLIARRFGVPKMGTTAIPARWRG